ncbi:MAG: hypothetical protein AAB390_00620 [Patescibacteria group bacterium]
MAIERGCFGFNNQDCGFGSIITYVRGCLQDFEKYTYKKHGVKPCLKVEAGTFLRKNAPKTVAVVPLVVLVLDGHPLDPPEANEAETLPARPSELDLGSTLAGSFSSVATDQSMGTPSVQRTEMTESGATTTITP